jgi:hypothetical protein
MAAFKFYLQSEKQRKLWWLMVYDTNIVFGKKFPGEEGSVSVLLRCNSQFFCSQSSG